MFPENSYGYRPGRSAKDAIQKVKEYAEQGYIHGVALDLSKHFDTLNHEILLNILRRNVRDERVIQWIKRYLKSGVMENGVVMETRRKVRRKEDYAKLSIVLPMQSRRLCKECTVFPYK